jgi:hypothetical protein
LCRKGDPALGEVARLFDLPGEAEDARRVVAQLVSTLERVGQVHNFVKGMVLDSGAAGRHRAGGGGDPDTGGGDGDAAEPADQR